MIYETIHLDSKTATWTFFFFFLLDLLATHCTRVFPEQPFALQHAALFKFTASGICAFALLWTETWGPAFTWHFINWTKTSGSSSCSDVSSGTLFDTSASPCCVGEQHLGGCDLAMSQSEQYPSYSSQKHLCPLIGLEGCGMDTSHPLLFFSLLPGSCREGVIFSIPRRIIDVWQVTPILLTLEKKPHEKNAIKTYVDLFIKHVISVCNVVNYCSLPKTSQF